MLAHVRPALIMPLLLTLITGMIYPMLVTGIGRALFAEEAEGSLIVSGAQVVGSSLIGQPFSSPRYFWPRPSATSPFPYHAANSGGSNLGPLNPALAQAVQSRIRALQEADPHNERPIPVDLVTASGSGLDPHISPAAAEYQVNRVARARGLSDAQVRSLVARHTEGRQFGLLGEPRVNVLRLNLALDQDR